MKDFNKLYEYLLGFGNTTGRIYQMIDKKETIVYTDVWFSINDIDMVKEAGFENIIMFAKENRIEVWIS